MVFDFERDGRAIGMSEFVEHLQEVLGEFGPITARRMFGGYGVYHAGVMIGLVADDVLYLKADGASAPGFVASGLPQFKYPKGDKLVAMSYYQAPAEALEDPAVMREWAQRAFEAALRARR